MPSNPPSMPPSSRGSGTRGSIKGTVLVSRLAFVRGQRGSIGVEAVRNRLPDEDQRVLSNPIMPFGWYPFELATRLDAAIAEVMDQGKGIFRTLGAVSARDNLSADHKRFVAGRDPHGLLRNAASIYKLYYDTGERTYERTGEKSAVLRTLQSRTFSAADCLTVVGWHEKAIEMCGGQAVRVTEPQCRARGGKLCEYVCEWE